MEIKFRCKLARAGEGKRILWIPTKHLDDIKDGSYVEVIVRELK